MIDSKELNQKFETLNSEEFLNYVLNLDLKEFPPKLLCEDLLILLIKKKQIKFNEIPADKINKKIVLNYLKYCFNTYDYDDDFSIFPKEFQTDEFLIELINFDGNLLKHIPKNRLNQKLCNLSVQTNKIPLLFDIPKEFRTREICLKTLEIYGNLYNFWDAKNNTNDFTQQISFILDLFNSYKNKDYILVFVDRMLEFNRDLFKNKEFYKLLDKNDLIEILDIIVYKIDDND